MGLSLQEAVLLFQLLAGVAEQIHTLWGDGKRVGVRGRDLLWVSRDDGTPPHTSCSSPSFIQSSKKAEAKLVKMFSFWGRRSQKPPNYYRKRKRLCQLFFQEDGKLEGTPWSWVRKLILNRKKKKKKIAHSLRNETICDPVSSDLKRMELEVSVVFLAA